MITTQNTIQQFIQCAQFSDISTCEHFLDQNEILVDDALLNCLKFKCFKICSWLIHKKKATIYHNYQHLSRFCAVGSAKSAIQIYSWIYQTFPTLIDRSHLLTVFLDCCCRGNLEFAQWLYQHYTINISYRNSIFFKGAVLFGHLDVIDWLSNISTDSTQFMMWSAIHACQEGHLHVLQWIIKKSQIDIHESNEYLLRIAIIYKHLHVIQYLIESCQADPTNISDPNLNTLDTSSDNEAIELACRTGSIDITRYMVEYFEENHPAWNIHDNDDFIFIMSCIGSKLEIVQYLYQLKIESFTQSRIQYCFKETILDDYYSTDHAILNYEQFRILDWLFTTTFPTEQECKKNHEFLQNILLDLCESTTCNSSKIEWLLDVCPHVDIHYKEDLAFIKACQAGQIRTAQLLYQIANKTNDPINIRSMQDSAFHFAVKRHHYDIVQWLVDITDSYSVIFKDTGDFISFEIDNDEDDFYDCEDWERLSGFYHMRQCKIPNQLSKTLQKINKPKTCSICLETCQPTECVETSCHHWFCTHDFFRWVSDRNRRECPMCRQRIILSNTTIFLHS